MTVLTNSGVDPKVLVADCVPDDAFPKPTWPSMPIGFHLFSFDELPMAKATIGRYDFVLALFDPASRNSVATFVEIHETVRQTGKAFGALPSFCPAWIDNLMRQMNVRCHFTSFPNLEVIKKMMVAQKE